MTIAVTWQNNPSVAQGLMFNAPLITSLVPVSAGGSYTPTFTRATTATRVNSSGLIELVGSGEARFDYDPVTLLPKGYLSEGARTNLCLQSEALDVDGAGAPWLNSGQTVSADAAVAPDGATTADSIVETATTAVHYVQQTLVRTASSPVTFSVYLKAGTKTSAEIGVSDNVSGQIIVAANLSAGTVGAVATSGNWTSASASISEAGSGWYRVSITATGGAGTVALVRVGSSISAVVLGVITNQFYGWGAQFEDNCAFASSYIPTTTVAVTRNVDVLTYVFAGNANAAVGTLYAEARTVWSGVSSGDKAIVAFASGYSALRVGNTFASTTIGTSDNTSAINKTGLTDLGTDIRKRGVSWGSGRSVTGDGATAQTGVFDGSMGNTVIAVGCDSAGAVSLFGTIRNVRIYNYQFSDAQLQAMTA